MAGRLPIGDAASLRSIMARGLEKGKGGWQSVPKGKHGGERRRKGNSYEYRYPDGQGGFRSSPGRRQVTSGGPKVGLKTRLARHKEQKIVDMQRRHKEEAGKRLQATLDEMKRKGPTHKPNPPFDFAGWEERSEMSTSDELRASLRDIMKTLPGADALDRETGTDNGGRYRDQSSVIRRELKLRAENPARETQGQLKSLDQRLEAANSRVEAYEEKYQRANGHVAAAANVEARRDAKIAMALRKKRTTLVQEIAALKKKPKITAADTPTSAADTYKSLTFTVPSKRYTVPKVGEGFTAPGARAPIPYEELEKAGGWGAIPAGKRGGQRKRVGMKWVYRYPDGAGGWQSGTSRKQSDTKKKKAAAKKQAQQSTLDFGATPDPKTPEPGGLSEIVRLAVSDLKLGDVLRPFGDQGFKISAIGKQGKKIQLATLDTATGESVDLIVNPGDKVWAQQTGPAKPKSPEKAPEGTPRGEAESTTEEMVVESDYVNDRTSAVEQRGEDVLGSARHKMAVWKGLRAALDDREWASDLFTRKFLQREKPVDFLGRAQKAPGSVDIKAQLHLYLSGQKFPATIPKTTTVANWYRAKSYDEDRSKKAEYAARGEQYYPEDRPRFHTLTEEEQQGHTEEFVRTQREGYYRAFILVNDSLEKQSAKVAADGAGDSHTIDMTAVNQRFKDLQKKPYAERIADAEYETLRKYYNGHAGRKKSRPVIQIGQVLQEVEKRNPGNEDGQIKDFQEAALKIMEGKSINKALDNVKKRESDFNVADFYDTGVMKRKGPPSRYKGIDQGLDLLDKGSGKSVYEMRGVQWGKSVTDSEREHHLKSIVDSWDDLSFVTGLPATMASYNGKLALAVGARGHGNASAHYEPSQNVINLTRSSGAGALAHEWGHFFDFEVAKAELREGQADAKTPMSEKYTRAQQGPTGKAVAALKSSAAWSAFDARLGGVCRSYRMTKGKTHYWRSDLEMFARCFERHAQRKLHKAGRENTYLTGLSAGSITKEKGLWPTDEETDAMAPFFEKVFAEFKTSGLLEKMMRWAEEDSLRKAAFTVPKKRFVVGDIR